MIRTILIAGACALTLALGAHAEEGPADVHGAALHFLLGKQHPNGGFGQIPDEEPGEVGITAMVLRGLANLPEDLAGEDGVAEAKAKAIEYLLARQADDGSFTKGMNGLGTYRTALTISALVAVDKEKYAAQIEKAAGWLKGNQFNEDESVDESNPHYGGFGYDHGGTKPDADMSNTQIALTAFRDAGISPDDPVFKRAVTFLSRCQNSSETNPGIAKLKPKDDGGFIYDPGLSDNKSSATKHEDGTTSYESYASMTYAGLMSLLYAGVAEDDPRVQAAKHWIANNYTLEENRGLGIRASSPDAAQQGLYYYYQAFAKCLAAVDAKTIATQDGERNWAQDLFEALAARQSDDGSFTNPNSRWWEQDPVLCTAYALNAMDFLRRPTWTSGVRVGGLVDRGARRRRHDHGARARAIARAWRRRSGW
ncbi:MAG: prenyltransferase/squalene oxidase repeat-containing protein [Planctomycetota bacterium]